MSPSGWKAALVYLCGHIKRLSIEAEYEDTCIEALYEDTHRDFVGGQIWRLSMRTHRVRTQHSHIPPSRSSVSKQQTLPYEDTYIEA